MRTASLIFLLFLQTTSIAGFTVTSAPAQKSNIYFEAVEARAAAIVAMTPKELEDSLSRCTAKLANPYLDIIEGSLSYLLTPMTVKPLGGATSSTDMHFTLTAPVSSKTFNPEDLRLDIFFDINGVDMGGLGSVSGEPIGNGRQGIVRIDGMTGKQLPHYFGPEPYIQPQSSGQVERKDVEVTLAQEFACMLFIAAAFVSTLRHREQQEHQQKLRRRRSRVQTQPATAMQLPTAKAT